MCTRADEAATAQTRRALLLTPPDAAIDRNNCALQKRSDALPRERRGAAGTRARVRANTREKEERAPRARHKRKKAAKKLTAVLSTDLGPNTHNPKTLLVVHPVTIAMSFGYCMKNEEIVPENAPQVVAAEQTASTCRRQPAAPSQCSRYLGGENLSTMSPCEQLSAKMAARADVCPMARGKLQKRKRAPKRSATTNIAGYPAAVGSAISSSATTLWNKVKVAGKSVAKLPMFMYSGPVAPTDASVAAAQPAPRQKKMTMMKKKPAQKRSTACSAKKFPTGAYTPYAMGRQPRGVSMADGAAQNLTWLSVGEAPETQCQCKSGSNMLPDPVDRLCATDIPRVYNMQNCVAMAPAPGPTGLTRDTSYAKVLYTNRNDSALYSFPDPGDMYPKGAAQAYNKQLFMSGGGFEDDHFQVINTSHDDSAVKGTYGYYDSCCGQAE
jgi:hypothetical protein